MASRQLIFLFLLTVVTFTSVQSLFFHVTEAERKCFIEEIPDDTIVVGTYKVEVFDPHVGEFMPSIQGIGMHVDIQDPDDQTVLSKIYSSEGRFMFTSHTPGEHTICLYSNSSSWFAASQLRIHLRIDVGEEAMTLKYAARKEKLTEMELRIEKVLNRVEQIAKIQQFLRFREENYRKISDSTNQQVLWWSAAQTVIVFIICYYQMRHLKSFFQAKKLV